MADLLVIINVSVEDDEQKTQGVTRGGRGGWNPYNNATLSTRSGGETRLERIATSIPAERLAESMKEIKSSLDEVFASIAEVGDFELSEIKLGLEITAKGKFALIASAEAGAKGAITLTFTPPKKTGS
ncbi:MAG TPA: hypothetical protein ENJ33_03195 [Thiothrix sp.]|nr:hypothetical protein [Thiothrix sp.]